MPKIVLAGQDFRLQETRGQVLRTTGAEVICCFGHQALNVVKSEKPELLVMCHTMPPEDAEAIALTVHDHSPETRVLLMLSRLNDGEPEVGGRFYETSGADPEQLVARATKLLSCLTQHRLKAIATDRQEPPMN